MKRNDGASGRNRRHSDDARDVARASKETEQGELDTNQVRILRALAPGDTIGFETLKSRIQIGISRENKYSGAFHKSLQQLEQRGMISIKRGAKHFFTIQQSGKRALVAAEGALRRNDPSESTSRKSIRLRADDAAPDDSEADGGYRHMDGDDRRTVERQIRERRGQARFRNSLRKRYGDHCLVTGCEVLDVLEAAHIDPYRGEKDNRVENGLLLRADIHTLFDLDLLGIEPSSLRVELNPVVGRDPEFKRLSGERLRCENGRTPSRDALRRRYATFQNMLRNLK